jgi:aspartate aminotransferase-like enzyme
LEQGETVKNDYQPVLISPQRYAAIEQRFARLLSAPGLFLLQGEAMIALEAVARGVGRPGSRALNIVTGPYGQGFGNWLSQQGVMVENLVVPFDRAVAVDEVREALAGAEPFDVVSVVHAEAATGAVNNLERIAALARDTGALTVVDAVASVGADPLAIEGWGLDVAVVSAQKALGGPAGVTGVVISEAGWSTITANPNAPRNSMLSLLDWREFWLETDRTALPAIPNHLETSALDEALSRVEDEGLAHVIARHAAVRDACRRGVRALGLSLWVVNDDDAAAVATTVTVPEGIASVELVAAVMSAADGGLTPIISVAPGSLRQRALRISHTGPRATTSDVLAAVAALGLGLQSLGVTCNIGAATEAVLGA